MNTLNNTSTSPFHSGEQQIQQSLGVRDKMERFGRQVIRGHMPEQHREFYAQLPFIFAGHTDAEGWPWASILFNQPGFISSTDNKHLFINTLPVSGDPLTGSLDKGNRLGLLGIELETRRRNRLSTHISDISDQGIELKVDQAFGNCPQYIQHRELQTIDPSSMPALKIEDLTQFDQQAIELISNSDTFFVASDVSKDNSDTVSEGADVSHRGGKPGFIRVDDNQTLTIPDYLGNFHFNTLGNFLKNAKAGLLFIDFTHGHLLTLTGSVEILWDSPDTQFFSGAERLWKFHINHGRWLKNSLPLRWKLQEYSPNTKLTGCWKEADAAKKSAQLKNTWQPYQITKIIDESSVIKSFYLQVPIGQKPQFKAGQFLTLKANINNKQYIRTYTVSSAPGDEQLRISIKHQRGNNESSDGVFSSFMHMKTTVGDIIQAKAPTGSFSFNTSNKRSVLISAGIGITPMIAMARHVLQEGIRTRSMQELTIICSAHNHTQRAFFSELNTIAEHSAGHIRVFWALSQAESDLKTGVDYHHKGRISKQWLETILPNEDYDVYLCGPSSFMQSQYNSLRDLGVSDAHIFSEAFGPASLIRDKEEATQLPVAEEAIVTFTESTLEQAWSKADGNLLEFSEAHGLTPEYGCRSGQCGTCKVKLLKGKVTYQQTIDTVLDKDEILLCCALPAVDMESKINRLEIKI